VKQHTNSPQVLLSSQKARKHSTLGIGSFISAMVASLFALPIILMFFGGFSPNYFELLFGGLLAALVGIGSGIAAMVQKGTSKIFGILGLVVSGLILLGLGALGILMVLYAH
jgi:hypothetical protein